MNKEWKPKGYNSVSTYLICKDAEAVIGFMQAVFDGRLLRRFDRPDGSLMHAEVMIDDTVVMLGGAANGGDYQAHVHVYVGDVDAVYRRALDCGATSVQAPERKRPDDDRRGGVTDPCGNIWWIATQ